jgi:hypothetical protein
MKKTFKKNRKERERRKTLKRKGRDRQGGFLSKLAEKVGLRTIRNQGPDREGYDGFTLDGPTTSDKVEVEEDFGASPTTPELSDDERVSSFTSTLTPDMNLDERLPGLIETLRSIKDDKNFEKAIMSLPNKVITKLPMDIIGRRARLGGGGKSRSKSKRKIKRKRTLKRGVNCLR